MIFEWFAEDWGPHLQNDKVFRAAGQPQGQSAVLNFFSQAKHSHPADRDLTSTTPPTASPTSITTGPETSQRKPDG